MSLEAEKEALMQRTFMLMFRILLVFGLPAFLAYHIGGFIDGKFALEKPYGTLVCLGVAFVSSWVMVFRIYFSLEKEYKALEAKERALDEAQSDQPRN
jgi:hypothetical protein